MLAILFSSTMIEFFSTKVIFEGLTPLSLKERITFFQNTLRFSRILEEVSYIPNTDTCECRYSQFCDPHHEHGITGDLRIIDNSKLKKLMTKGRNYRDPVSLIFLIHLIQSPINTTFFDWVLNNFLKAFWSD